MKVIVDSGSTKADWTLTDEADGRIVAELRTQGITPVHQSADAIRHLLADELVPQLAEEPSAVSAVHFYGSGCLPEHVAPMQQLLGEVFTGATQLEVATDLLAAARALCGSSEGMACILGTGSNSCLYDGTAIRANTPALGYVLGDEGSGAVLGRLFLNAIFKRPQLASLRDEYLVWSGQTTADVIRRTYREPMAARFLASVSPFVRAHLHLPEVAALVVDNFRAFFRINLSPYGRPDLPVHFVGSMAHYYRDQLAEAAHAEGYQLGRVERTPMAGLIRFHHNAKC